MLQAPQHADRSDGRRGVVLYSAIPLVLGGGGITDPASAVLGGGGMTDPASAVLGGGGIKDPDNVVHGGGGIRDPESAVHGGGGINEPDNVVHGGGGIRDPDSAVHGGGGIKEPDSAAPKEAGYRLTAIVAVSSSNSGSAAFWPNSIKLCCVFSGRSGTVRSDKPQASPTTGGVPDVPDWSQSALAALFDRSASLAARPRTVRALPGGLTNRNYQVSVPDGTFVARISDGGGDLLAIDRDCEYRNAVTAAAAGAGPPVIEYRPADHLLVIAYLQGRTLAPADVAAEPNISRVAQACRRLHAGARFANDFDMFDIQRRYREVVRSRGFAIPAGYDNLAPQVQAARTALAVRAEATVPCHNDLLAANFIDDGDRIWLIDYELSGNNDACFELGNIAAESQLDTAALTELITAYYGRPRRAKVARARLLGLVGMYGWTLWGAIQHASSPIEFDFWSWATERFEGAAAGFTADSYPELLQEVTRDD